MLTCERWPEQAQIKELIGKTLSHVALSDNMDQIDFIAADGDRFSMFHDQDCCETVTVNDICGDLQDLVGSPIIEADESMSNKNPDGVEVEYQDSFTWTFYNIRTIKGGVTIRWYGESNGYYSEEVTFYRHPSATAT